MKLPFPFKSKELTPEMFSSSSSSSAAAAWPWPTCATPKTVSFRASDVLKTMNAAYAAPESEVDEEYEEEEDAAVESVIRGLRSERLFFEPGETSSILEDAKLSEPLSELESESPPFSESVAVAVDSRDPFVDFRASMEEMVEAHGVKDWAAMEELLTCYLKVNGKSNHGYIVGAFVDLLVSLATRNIIDPSSGGGDRAAPTCSASSMSHSFTSPFSFSSSATTSSSTMISPSLSLLEVDDETEKSSVSSSSNHISIVPSNSS